ncbi:helix-turn-helix domain-containing protein [Enterococcus sp. BWR-S5]|uniref:helix-turn-helix domain-containing protein n=1 Tax=Enterococcus sp. BWR-S5 TaxID=2787714 RepID=UPI001921167E|nr:helix-turn-helix transcriptional regulator [Enterococcus sp. BWR-S5]MBL1226133.1 helix-turn-helix transcriptional regulator [Enterococcus sp. BWR-S5]
MKLGAYIQFYRKKRALTQAELAERICSQAEISLIEQGKRTPSYDMLMKLCSRLNISMESITEKSIDHIEVLNESFQQLNLFLLNREYEKMDLLLNDETIWRAAYEKTDKQKLLYYQGIYTCFHLKDNTKALNLLKLGLTETLSLKNRDLHEILNRKKIFQKTETLLIGSIGAVLHLDGKYKEAELFFDTACSNINNLAFQDQPSELAIIYYSASKNYKYLNMHTQALDIAMTGKDWVLTHHSTARLPEMLYEIAENYRILEEPERAECYYISSLSAALAIEDKIIFDLMCKEYQNFTSMKKLQSFLKVVKCVSC